MTSRSTRISVKSVETEIPDAMDVDDIDEEEEELPMSDDVIRILGFNPDEYDESEEDGEEDGEEEK
jgi:hypothetical protein